MKGDVTIDEIEYIGIKNTNRDLLEDKIGIKSGHSYSISQINTGFRDAFSSRYYNTVYYQLKPKEAGHAKLICVIKEAPLTQAKIGVSYLTYTGFAVIANLTARDLLFTKSRTMAKLAIGEYIRGLVQHRQAFGREANSFFNISYGYDHLPLSLYDETNKRAVYNINRSIIDMNLTKVLTINWSITAGTNFQNVRYSPEVSPELSYKGSFSEFYSYMRVESKTINSPNFPTKGYDLLIEAGIDYNRSLHITADSVTTTTATIANKVSDSPQLYRLKLRYIKYNSVSSRSTLILKFDGSYCIDSKGFVFDNYFLGGVQQILNLQMPFVGINEGQILSDAAIIGMIGYQYNLIGRVLILGRINAAVYNFDDLWATSATRDIHWISGCSLGLGYDFGSMPIEVTAMYSPAMNVVYPNMKLGFIF